MMEVLMEIKLNEIGIKTLSEKDLEVNSVND